MRTEVVSRPIKTIPLIFWPIYESIYNKKSFICILEKIILNFNFNLFKSAIVATDLESPKSLIELDLVDGCIRGFDGPALLTTAVIIHIKQSLAETNSINVY